MAINIFKSNSGVIIGGELYVTDKYRAFFSGSNLVITFPSTGMRAVEIPFSNVTIEGVAPVSQSAALVSLSSVFPDANSGAGSPGYFELYGLLTQTGTNAPTITIFENTFSVTPTLTYEQVGWYLMDLGLSTSAFGRIYMVLGYLEVGGRYKTELLGGGGSAGKIRIYTWGTNNTTNENGKLLQTSVHLRYYPV